MLQNVSNMFGTLQIKYSKSARSSLKIGSSLLANAT